jgi:hypothetical protein
VVCRRFCICLPVRKEISGQTQKVRKAEGEGGRTYIDNSTGLHEHIVAARGDRPRPHGIRVPRRPGDLYGMHVLRYAFHELNRNWKSVDMDVDVQGSP